ncbi:MAG TPA: phosphoribosylamine--glycine ligase [Candidatus Hydrogenedentes bacterium]|nr:phosphoribosylamine--glycine ligase [Candidatus Hydrogenedentota bacterium]HQL94824.1 phosphoribosylamine--glycine ligase [Candidatus Hydrogenedentota bacterium]
MKVLVIGSGGREHALAWKIARSASVEQVIGAPGNPGIASLDKGLCVPVDGMDFAAVKALIEDKDIGLTVVGPEAPLAEGLVDYLSEGGDLVFGPCRQAAQLEGSKAFAKAFMRRHNIPTADYAVFDSAEEAERHVRENGAPIVVKADGLAAGKGVTVAMTEEEAVAAIREAMIGGVFGDAGRRVVLEEYMTGEEASILAFCDGETVVPMASSQDHKPALDGDKGPNTGGMGAYSPAPVVDDETARRVYDEILLPCVRGMAAEGAPYKGVLYAGIMVTERGPRVVEFNVRFGDPETQVVLPRMTSDIVPVLVACARGGLADVPVVYADTPCVTVVMASGGYPGAYEKGKEITGIAEAEREPGVQVFHAGTRMDGGKLVTAGGRVLNVTATGATLPEAITRAYTAVDCIRFDGAHVRRDIGRKALRRLGLA